MISIIRQFRVTVDMVNSWSSRQSTRRLELVKATKKSEAVLGRVLRQLMFYQEQLRHTNIVSMVADVKAHS